MLQRETGAPGNLTLAVEGYALRLEGLEALVQGWRGLNC